jgi:hypothetical protein
LTAVEEYELKITATDGLLQVAILVSREMSAKTKPPSQQWIAKLATLDARMRKLEATIVLIT